jgi:hypothetical protein
VKLVLSPKQLNLAELESQQDAVLCLKLAAPYAGDGNKAKLDEAVSQLWEETPDLNRWCDLFVLPEAGRVVDGPSVEFRRLAQQMRRTVAGMDEARSLLMEAVVSHGKVEGKGKGKGKVTPAVAAVDVAVRAVVAAMKLATEEAEHNIAVMMEVLLGWPTQRKVLATFRPALTALMACETELAAAGGAGGSALKTLRTIVVNATLLLGKVSAANPAPASPDPSP